LAPEKERRALKELWKNHFGPSRLSLLVPNVTNLTPEKVSWDKKRKTPDVKGKSPSSRQKMGANTGFGLG